MKKSSRKPRTIHVVVVAALIFATKFGWEAGQGEALAQTSPLRQQVQEIIQVAEEIEDRQVVDESSIVGLAEHLGAECSSLAQEYTDYSYSTNLLKIAHVLGEEVYLPDHETRYRTLSALGQEFLDAECSTGFLMQMMARGKSIERYVNDELYRISQAN